MLVLENKSPNVKAHTIPATANDGELSNLVSHYSDSFSIKFKEPTIPPELPTQIMVVMRFVVSFGDMPHC